MPRRLRAACPAAVTCTGCWAAARCPRLTTTRTRLRAPRGAERSPQGVALISVGGQPAKAYRTGAEVTEELVLLAVGRRSASLGPRGGPAETELRLPEPVRGTALAAPGGFMPRPGAVVSQPGNVGAQVRPMMGQPNEAGRTGPQNQAGQAADDEDDE
jgi:general secretion pathway protein C